MYAREAAVSARRSAVQEPRGRRGPWRARAALGLLGLLAGAATGRPAQAAPVDPSLSDERLEASYNASDDFVKYPALDAYLRALASRLQQGASTPAPPALRLHALTSSLPYAFALGNGAAYVSSGLIARLDDESQLAALIALPLAAAVSEDRKALDATARKRALRNMVPNILLIAVTVGLGAGSVVKAEEKARAADEARAQSASDAVALGWLAAAGYDPHAATLALRTLAERLEAEQRSGPGEFNDPVRLRARAEAIEQALVQSPPALAAAAPVDPNRALSKLSSR